MAKDRNKLNLKLKLYHVIILGFILSSLIVYNSNLINAEKRKEELYKEKSQLFDKIISIRKLNDDGSADNATQNEDKDDSKTGKTSDEVCKKGSEELYEYYKTGDLSTIDIEDGKIKWEESNEEYFQSLLNIVRSLFDESENKESSRNLQ